ncbi:glycosyltransferase [Nodularia harveyana UHCC-0300]|uniref:Glycosyltransferase n=1 Tax=Nodularia harveyana UHCC-0300 TaxID=2974287 RepID=A0ABU5UHE2_9CYAN|nr:glycosyltransferase [Nodularia harveyana]MEA5582956.1 glycosyltransferase [Nodularia harveyana UHCC-0300]
MNKTWLIYALGGGWGHLNRALSLGRIAAQYINVRIITNSPYVQQVSHEGCSLDWIPDDAGFSKTCLQVKQILLTTKHDCLIVDTFPRGLGGELADILPELKFIPKILIHRDLNPKYITAKNLQNFVAANFDSVIVPGEGKDLGLANLPIVHHTAPWLIRNPEELPERNTTRSRILRVEATVNTILVCAAGNVSELDIFSQITLRLQQEFPQCAVRILAHACPVNCPETLWVNHHPGIECFAAADVVIGGAGYNTVYECAAVGVPLIALAFPRLYDRQAKRARKSYYVQNIEQAIAIVRILLNQLKTAKKQSISTYINGAVQAVEQIMSYKL